ncbi:hypothetical protein GQ44DRAFT_348647 [Phaeosphaeriaceae sp. PMI808]|nr:hypothetical protein GQ44DRAFT_348647 [Phaeosphaeriaceae sp. PMI808]
MDTEAQCQLCQLRLPSLTQLRRHLGRHHEELSLFALPSHMEKDGLEDEDAINDDGSQFSIADSDGSQPQLDISCENCGQALSGKPEERLKALNQHWEAVHGRYQRSDEDDPRFVEARELLRAKPFLVQAMDDRMFDPTLLDSNIRLELPVDVNTWAELKHWFHEKLRSNESEKTANLERLYLLQAVQFGTTISTQDIDSYFEKMVQFYKDEFSLSIEEHRFHLDNKIITLQQVLRASRIHGGFEMLQRRHTWTDLGFDLGHEKRLTSNAAKNVRTVYRDYVVRFEEQIMQRPTIPLQTETIESEGISLHRDSDVYPPVVQDIEGEWPILVNGQGIESKSANLKVYRNHFEIQFHGWSRPYYIYYDRIEHLDASEDVTIQAVMAWLMDTASGDLVEVFRKRFSIVPIYTVGIDAMWRCLVEHKLRYSSNYALQRGIENRALSPVKDDEITRPAKTPEIIAPTPPLLPNAATWTEALVFGIPTLRDDIRSTIQFHHGCLDISHSLNTRSEKGKWSMWQENFEKITLVGRQVNLRGWLEGSDVPELKNVTMTFRESGEAESIYTELSTAHKYYGRNPQDVAVTFWNPSKEHNAVRSPRSDSTKQAPTANELNDFMNSEGSGRGLYTIDGIPGLSPTVFLYASLESDALVLQVQPGSADQIWRLPKNGFERLYGVNSSELSIRMKSLVTAGPNASSLGIRELILKAINLSSTAMTLSVLRVFYGVILESPADEKAPYVPGDCFFSMFEAANENLSRIFPKELTKGTCNTTGPENEDSLRSSAATTPSDPGEEKDFRDDTGNLQEPNERLVQHFDTSPNPKVEQMVRKVLVSGLSDTAQNCEATVDLEENSLIFRENSSQQKTWEILADSLQLTRLHGQEILITVAVPESDTHSLDRINHLSIKAINFDVDWLLQAILKLKGNALPSQAINSHPTHSPPEIERNLSSQDESGINEYRVKWFSASKAGVVGFSQQELVGGLIFHTDSIELWGILDISIRYDSISALRFDDNGVGIEHEGRKYMTNIFSDEASSIFDGLRRRWEESKSRHRDTADKTSLVMTPLQNLSISKAETQSIQATDHLQHQHPEAVDDVSAVSTLPVATLPSEAGSNNVILQANLRSLDQKLEGTASYSMPLDYRWVCCQCLNDNSWTLNRRCMGDNCDHLKGCSDCKVYK